MLFEDLTDVWNAFQDLSTCRACGFSPNPIAWDQMLAWFQVYGIEDTEMRDTYCHLIMAMDAVFLEHVAEAKNDGD